jgi:sirohydrochlorin ferrochelatase
MGVDHEAGPAVPDPASRDHGDSPIFDVWATRDRDAGPALPAQTSDAAPEDPPLPGPALPEQALPEQALPEQEGDLARPSGESQAAAQTPVDQEGGSPLPTRVPRTADGPPALPTRTPHDQDGAPALPTRTPQDGAPALPTRTPQDGAPALPTRTPQDGATALPTRTPQDGATALPTRTPQDGAAALPTRTPHTQDGAGALPTRDPQGARNGPVLPVRNSGTAGDGSVLPVRTSRYRRTGRHSSPHQLSLPSDTPALVIAVPGAARPESEDAVGRIAELAGTSCHGAEVRVGYLRGNQDFLEEVLDGLVSANGGPAAVVVPLLAFPNAEVDSAIADIVEASPTPFLVAAHLGPHPLLAEALHARLADARLARAARVGRISIVTAADGVIVGAAGEDEALEGAGVVAVLLASRLTMPVAAASLTDPGSIKDAANRLREARVARVALAPCMIGPELTAGTLDAIAALTATEYAPPLGSHPAVAQLVAIRYGAALADPKVATMVAEARGEPLPASPVSARVSPPAPAT